MDQSTPRNGLGTPERRRKQDLVHSDVFTEKNAQDSIQRVLEGVTPCILIAFSSVNGFMPVRAWRSGATEAPQRSEDENKLSGAAVNIPIPCKAVFCPLWSVSGAVAQWSETKVAISDTNQPVRAHQRSKR